jgi:hypothetical protein
LAAPEAVVNRIHWVSVLTGIWLIISPYALNYAGSTPAAAWNNSLVGIAVMLVATYVLFARVNAEVIGWGVVALGLWEIVAPFVLGYSNQPALLWNNVVVGIVIVAVGALSARFAWGRGRAV